MNDAVMAFYDILCYYKKIRSQQNTVQYAHTNHRAGEHRLIAFGGLQEIPKPTTNPEKPAEPIVQHTDGTRAYAKLQAMLKELADTEHLVAKDAVANFRAKLEGIRAKLQALDASRTEAILALEKEAYADCSPYLEKSFMIRLSGCPKIVNPVLKKEKLDCEFGGENASLTLTPSHQVDAVNALGVTVQLQEPVDIEEFDKAVGDNLLGSLRLIAKRFDIKTLKLAGNKTRIEWTVDGKRFVASSVDVLEVVQSPKPELLHEYKTLTAEMRALTKGLYDLEKRIPWAVLTELRKTLKSGGDPDVRSLTADQKQTWEALKPVYAQQAAINVKISALSEAVSLRILRAEDGTTVRENGSPESTNYVKWTYLDAEGKNRKDVEWSSATMVVQNEYERGQLIRSTSFSFTKNGLPVAVKDLQANTKDYFDDKGQKSHREVLDPKDSETVTDTLLFNTSGTLLDDAALQAMTPEQIEAIFLGRLSQETRGTKNPIFNSCFSYAKHLAKCPRAKEIFRLALRNDPIQAFTMFEAYQDIPGAVDLLEEAAYQLADKKKVLNALFTVKAVSRLSDDQKRKIIDMANRKASYEATFVPRYLRNDYEPEKNKFLADPALFNLQEVQGATRKLRHYVGEVPLSWLRRFKDEIDAAHMPRMSYAEGSDVEQQMMVIIARNLFFQNKAITPDTVMAETKRILDTRKQYADIPLFAGRNILHVAHVEKIRETVGPKGERYSNWRYDDAEKNAKDTHRFGTIAAQEAIGRQQSGRGSYSLLRPAAREEAKETKAKILQAIRTLAPPATFLFDGHGGPDAFFLTDGQAGGEEKVELGTVKISVEELADAFRERTKKFELRTTDNPEKKDICIFKSCYSATFVRTLYERLEGLPKPITLAAAEYGQKGYTNFEAPFISKFFSNALQLNRSNGATNFADVFRNEFNSPSNPSLYIPDESGRTMQISRNDTPSEPSNG